ncbi:hypothetical protein F2Q69_00041283 [Brassica cretica]|uniref:Uncharacterized protein n=1 Tax=Brassica cretica TaxID=69181 RepID=A0A8S9NHV7_BRACR|nr:hypothetical protein F2Q69_00041283 [Brassica cretica]
MEVILYPSSVVCFGVAGSKTSSQKIVETVHGSLWRDCVATTSECHGGSFPSSPMWQNMFKAAVTHSSVGISALFVLCTTMEGLTQRIKFDLLPPHFKVEV